MKTCPFCSTQNPDESVFCLSCGQNMNIPQAQFTPEAPVYQQPQPVVQPPQQAPVGSFAPPQAPASGFTPPPQPYAPPSYQSQPTGYAPAAAPVQAKQAPKVGDASKNWAAVLGMILGILSLVLCCVIYVAPIFALAGLIFSIMGKKSQKKGMAVAGMITSILGLVVGIIYIIIVAAAVSMPDWVTDIPGFSYSFEEKLI